MHPRQRPRSPLRSVGDLARPRRSFTASVRPEPNLGRVLGPALLALGLLVLGCGTPAEGRDGCAGAENCAAGQVCADGVCVPEGPRGCEPPCGGAQPVCDEERGFCKVCTPTAGCGGGTPYCLPAANGGEGLCVGCRDGGDCEPPSLCDPVSHACVGCTETEGCGEAAPICDGGTCVVCTDERGCGGETPVCDRSVNGGACVVCTAEAGCGDGTVCDRSVPGGACVTCTAEAGCGGETPVCDTRVPGGACVECVADDHCGDGRLCAAGRCVHCDDAGRGCAPPTPHCDLEAREGRGACVGCRSDGDCPGSAGVCHPERRVCVGCLSDLDCGGGRPRCDPEALGGAGACVACLSHADCGGNTPLCDRAADAGLGACITCTDQLGCGGGTFCDTSVPGGACVTCTADRGCSGTAPVCDTAVPGGRCVACLEDGDCTANPSRPFCDRTRGDRGACVACTADHRGCGGERPYCWTGGDSGAGVCNRCIATEGCGGDTPICDLSIAGGVCRVCTAGAGCGGTTPYCDTSIPGGACKKCLPDGSGCYSALPACDPAGGDGLGACVRCVANADCGGSTPVCDTETHTCVGCLASADCTYGGGSVCDPATRTCVTCLPTEGCDEERPFCFTIPWQTRSRCVECRDTADCDEEVEVCDGSYECLNFATDTIRGVRLSLGNHIHRATVTYLKPAVETEPAGFFLQGEPFFEAVFVAVDPSTLAPPPAVGDRVTFDVTATTTVSSMTHITALTNWSVASHGHSTQALVQDLSLDPWAAYPSNAYFLESALVAVTGRLEPFLPPAGGYVFAPIETVHWGPSPLIQLRVPRSLQESMDLAADCVVTLAAGPVWRIGATSLPSAYAPTDFAAVACPAPTLLSAAALSPTQVLLAFDRKIDPATVLADGSPFTIAPPLAVTAAAVSGKQVTLTTAPQSSGVVYTVTVAATVKDLYGSPVASPRAASFPGQP